MKRKWMIAAVGLLGGFVLWTAAVCLLDVQAIGPNGSSVGLAAINGFFHRLTGVHMSLYVLTDWLGLVPVFTGLGFAAPGLCQWIRRKTLFRVDQDILVLGIFYLVVLGTYLLFEELAINYRPVLINGVLEASYPSSTTLLVLCIMPTAALQLKVRLKNAVLKRCAVVGITVFTVLMVVLRLFSGVHWLTDIVGGVLLSGGLVCLYRAFSGLE